MNLIAKAIMSAILLSAGVLAQNAIPAGTVLPAEITSSLNSEKSKPGSTITARIMQDVPLPSGAKIRSGSKLLGKVVRVKPGKSGQGTEMTLRFDVLESAGHTVAITTTLRALASMSEVEDAQVPKVGADRGTPWAWSTRVLIGGEVAYGAGGPVARGQEIVGQALADGVLVPVEANRDWGCRGDLNGDTRPQALWVFSSNACGVYGFSNVQIVHAGRSKPEGDITLTSVKGKLHISRGSGLLLRIRSSLP